MHLHCSRSFYWIMIWAGIYALIGFKGVELGWWGHQFFSEHSRTSVARSRGKRAVSIRATEGLLYLVSILSYISLGINSKGKELLSLEQILSSKKKMPTVKSRGSKS